MKNLIKLFLKGYDRFFLGLWKRYDDKALTKKDRITIALLIMFHLAILTIIGIVLYKIIMSF